MQRKLPDIFEYVDFRKYLEDYRAARKAYDKGFTHTYICHKLGQRASRSYFNNVVKGRVALSSTFTDHFIDLLELGVDEAKYFRALVNYNQPSSAHEKEFYFDQLVHLNKTPKKLIDRNSYAYYKEWYHSTIRALLDIFDFNNDYSMLAKKLLPPITVRQAKQSIVLLQKLGLIYTNECGFLKPTEKSLSAGSAVKDHLIRQYQLKCLEIAKEHAATNRAGAEKISTITTSVSKEGYERIRARLDRLRSEVRSIVHKDEKKATGVYQINIHSYQQAE